MMMASSLFSCDACAREPWAYAAFKKGGPSGPIQKGGGGGGEGGAVHFWPHTKNGGGGGLSAYGPIQFLHSICNTD